MKITLKLKELVAEFFGLSNLESKTFIEDFLHTIIKEGQLNPHDRPYFVDFRDAKPKREISGEGYTVFLALKESHLVLNTWPELKYARLDIVTCGEEANINKLVDFFEEYKKQKKIRIEYKEEEIAREFKI